MKTHFFPLLIIVVSFSMSIWSCKKDNEIPADPEISTANIQVFRNGTLVTEFNSTEIGAMKDEETLYVSIVSEDDVHVLSIYVYNFKAGTFPVDFVFYESDYASMILYSDDLPGSGGMVVFSEGSLILEEVTSNRCKGTFEVHNLSDFNDVAFSMKGSFDFDYMEI